MNGKGIGIARAAFAAKDLATGRLVRPFDGIAPEPLPWFVATRKEGRPDPNTVRFVDWLEAEVAADPTVRTTQTSA